MATGASCPRRPKGERGEDQEKEEAEVVWESFRIQAEVRLHTHRHGFLFSILQEVKHFCVCVCVCVHECVCRCRGDSGI